MATVIDFADYLDTMTTNAMAEFLSDKAPVSEDLAHEVRQAVRREIIYRSAKRAVDLVMVEPHRRTAAAYAELGHLKARTDMLRPFMVEEHDDAADEGETTDGDE